MLSSGRNALGRSPSRNRPSFPLPSVEEVPSAVRASGRGPHSSSPRLPALRVARHRTSVERNDAFAESTFAEDDPLVATTSTMTTSAAHPQRGQKKIRQLMSREEKQRATLVEERDRAWSNLVNQASWSRAAIATFLCVRSHMVEKEQRQRSITARWDRSLVEEHLRRTLSHEACCRERLEKAQEDQRRTLIRLAEVEGAPLQARHRFARVVEAERVRRGFLYREEVREAFALGIPGYEPICLVVLRDETTGGGASPVAREKVDYLNHQCCPYAVVEDCPFLPQSVRFQLMRSGLSHTPGPAGGPTKPEFQPPGGARSRSVGPVPGKGQRQRGTTAAVRGNVHLSLRTAMKKGHYEHAASAVLAAAALDV